MYGKYRWQDNAGDVLYNVLYWDTITVLHLLFVLYHWTDKGAASHDKIVLVDMPKESGMTSVWW
jgi:wobble nucleotide-excising tRNase